MKAWLSTWRWTGRTPSKASVNDYDVVVLDRDLPRLHGDDVCHALVDSGRSARILMLTASGAVDDRVQGLSIGADDYLPKPFAFVELVARIRSLARRTTPALPPVLRAGDVELDPNCHVVRRAGREVPLAPKEFTVLELLLAAAGRTFSAEELLERGWDEFADPFTNTVRVTVMKLRRKLGDPPASGRCRARATGSLHDSSEHPPAAHLALRRPLPRRRRPAAGGQLRPRPVEAAAQSLPGRPRPQP